MASKSIKSTRTQDSDLAIQISGLTRVFDTLVAVDGIDLKIKKGELFALLGPNGAGKTTTINMLCCLLKPTGGTAKVMGYDINREPFKVKELIGVSPQETTLSEHLNSRENLNLIGRIHGVSSQKLKERVELLLETMGLAKRAKDQVRKFSGGMKRRLSIIMALVHNPQVLILDEPTLGLDPQARRAVWEYITRFKGKKTILLTTHYMEEADFLADRIGIIDDGKIVALGTSTELKISMLKKHTMVIQGWNLTQKVILDMRSRYAEVEVSNGAVMITDKRLDFKEVVDQLHAAGAVVRSAYMEELTLEDVFLDVTGKELRQ